MDEKKQDVGNFGEYIDLQSGVDYDSMYIRHDLSGCGGQYLCVVAAE